MDRTQRTGRGWRSMVALLLAALFGLQGCSAVATTSSTTRATTSTTSLVRHDGSLPIKLPGGALRYLEGEPASGSLLPVSCGFGFGVSKGEGAALIGILILASPLIVAAAAVALPFVILGAPLGLLSR